MSVNHKSYEIGRVWKRMSCVQSSCAIVHSVRSAFSQTDPDTGPVP